MQNPSVVSLVRRFGPTAELLADALPAFSIDIVGVVCSYFAFLTASENTTAEKILSFGSAGSGSGQFPTTCFGVACSADGKIWVAGGKKLQVFSAEGHFLHQVGELTPKYVMGVAFSADTAFVTDCRWHRLLTYTLKGAPLRVFGNEGKSSQQFDYPQGIAIDNKANLVFVAETQNERIKVLTTNLEYVREFGKRETETRAGAWGEAPDGRMVAPKCIAVNSMGELAVSDANTSRIQVFDQEGKFLRKFSFRNTVGTFAALGVCADRDNNWLVVCQKTIKPKITAPSLIDVAVSDGVKVFKPDGTFVTQFGQHGSEHAVKGAYSVCVDQLGRILVGGSDCVCVFGFVWA